MALRTGLDVIQDAIAKAQDSSAGGQQAYKKDKWFSWSKNEEKTLRFLTDIDEVIVVNLHDRVETKRGMRQFVCRKEFGAECPLCPMKGPDGKALYPRRERGYGVAVLRQPDVDKPGSFCDVIELVEVDGKKTPQPWVGIVAQSLSNFWLYLESIYSKQGSLKERDVDIRRVGEGLKTVYPASAPYQPQAIPKMATRYEKFMPNVKEYLERIGSEKYYDSYLGNGDAEIDQLMKDSEPYMDSELDRLRANLGV